MISTYTELKASILKWLTKQSGDTYFTDEMLDDIIYLAEAEMSRRLRVKQMRAQVSFDLIAGDNTQALPSGFVEPYVIYRTGASDEPNIEYRDPSFFANKALFVKTGTPQFFYFDEDSLVFGAVPSSDVNITVDYYKSIPNLSGSTTTNSVLTAFPDLYLVACLKQAYMANQDDKEIVYEQRMDKLIDQINRVDARNSMSSGSKGNARSII